jgi:dimethylamine monooxygenase subunit A
VNRFDSLPSTLNLEGLFAPNAYRFSMGLKRIAAGEFFSNSDRAELLEARIALLRDDPDEFVCEPVEAIGTAAVRQFASAWVDVSQAKTFRDLGMIWEPDFVLLVRDSDSIESEQVTSGVSPTVDGGCVCFPTGWSLPEKQGKPLTTVHGPVPGLNADIGSQIDRMLNSIRPGDGYQRMNWGLSSSDALNQHPNQQIEKIPKKFDPHKTFLRIEWQGLIALDAARLLFGIRPYHVALESLRRDSGLAELLSVNLRTMPEKVAQYKRIEECRDEVISYLSG